MTIGSSVAKHRQLFASSLAVFVYGLLLACFSIAGYSLTMNTHHFWPFLGDKPIGEDGYYMISVAQNLATSGHLTYTYGMTATGVQPMATFFFAGIAWLNGHLGGDTWTLLRAIILQGVVLHIVFAWLIAAVAARLAPQQWKNPVFVLACSIALFDYALFRLFTYGLETGVYLLFLGCCMWTWTRIAEQPRTEWVYVVVFGVEAGLAGEARIDFGLIFVVLLVYALLSRRFSFLQAGVCGLLALLIVSPWFIFVHRVSGSWIPSSGHAESSLIGSDASTRLRAMADAVAEHVAPWTFSTGHLSTLVFGLIGVGVVVLLVKNSKAVGPGLLRDPQFRFVFLPWIVAVTLLTFCYLALFWSTHFYSRYTAPLAVPFIPLLALLLAELRAVRTRPPLLCCAFACIFGLWALTTMHWRSIGNPHFVSASYIRSFYPKARVAAFQSGTLGYFDTNVMNLDGKLNQDALNIHTADGLDRYLDTQRIQVVIDWPSYLDKLGMPYLHHEFEPCPPPLENTSLCFVRKH